ncbi:Palmitoyltransferase [Parahypoxylon ruwenzoriense]
MAFLVRGSAEPALQRLAIPSVCVLIAFLAYTSQWLFAHAPDLDPGPLTSTESYTFNALLLCLWYTYYKACTVDPGRYVFPPSIGTDNSRDKDKYEKSRSSDDDEEADTRRAQALVRGARWCKKCAAPKPPRAHHCKTCRRCVPKMDHHCPWTSNCVSLQTFPHFLRFLVYTNLSLWTLLYLLLQRFLGLWHSRHLPAYLGPTLAQLALLTVLTFVAGVTSLALGLMLATTLKGWVFNTTMIESWEVERHEAALERRRGRYDADDDNNDGSGSWWAAGERAPGGDREAPHLSLEPVEFPYDIGFFANMAQAMGTRNPLLWLWPFAGGPVVAVPALDAVDSTSTTTTTTTTGGTGWAYDENGLNDREGMWPPPDPDKQRHARLWRARKREAEKDRWYEYERRSLDPADEREAFRRRQERDLRRWESSRILGELEELPPDYNYDDDEEYDYDFVDEQMASVGGRGSYNGAGWTNADGEQLGDYGVDDDDAESVDGPSRQEEGDEDVPIAELIRRRKVRTKDGEDT